MANHERDAAKERFWRDVLKRQAKSGLSVRAFCQREQLTESAFYAWRRTVAERNGEVKSPRAPAFLPMMVTDRSPRGASIEMELAGGRILRLPESISAQRLAEFVQALEAGAAR
jgi:transposase-like protein